MRFPFIVKIIADLLDPRIKKSQGNYNIEKPLKW